MAHRDSLVEAIQRLSGPGAAITNTIEPNNQVEKDAIRAQVQ
jgi:hypothetical protein